MHWFDSLQAERQGLRAAIRDARFEAEYWRREAIRAREALMVSYEQHTDSILALAQVKEQIGPELRQLLKSWALQNRDIVRARELGQPQDEETT